MDLILKCLKCKQETSNFCDFCEEHYCDVCSNDLYICYYS